MTPDKADCIKQQIKTLSMSEVYSTPNYHIYRLQIISILHTAYVKFIF